MPAILLSALAAPAALASEAPSPGPPGQAPTPEETREAERLARESLGGGVVEGARAFRDVAADRSLAGRALRAEQVAQAFSELTGTAVNPLFGLTALGMWRYFRTPSGLRDQLPFYDQPYVWLVLLAVLALMLFNSTLCEAMPPLKIPLNALGDLINKGGAALVLPVAIFEFASAFSAPAAETLQALAGRLSPVAYAASDAAGGHEGIWLALGWVAALTVGAASYAAVWVVWNVVDALIMISPFPGLDAALKAFRLSVMGVLAAAALLNPWMGFVLALLVLFVCLRLSGWAFRWSVMGFVFAWDFLLWRDAWADPARAPRALRAFAGADAAIRWKTPPRLCGRLESTPGGGLRFVWRPWLAGPRRELDLGRAGDYSGGSTLLFPVLLANGGAVLFRLAPRYRSQPRAIADALGLCGPWRDVSFARRLWSSVKPQAASER